MQIVIRRGSGYNNRGKKKRLFNQKRLQAAKKAKKDITY